MLSHWLFWLKNDVFRQRVVLVYCILKKRRWADATGGLLSKNFEIFTRKHMCGMKTLLNKVSGFGPATLLKRDTNTDVFLWVLGNF